MQFLACNLKSLFRRSGKLVFGGKPRLHRIPFGPIRGQKIYMSFELSPRMFLGLYDSWITKIASQFIKPGSTVYDVGAHVGYTTILFAHILNCTGEVHAFEILPSVANEFLARSIKGNSLQNVIIHNIGLSSSSGTIELPVIKTKMTSLKWESDRSLQTELCKIARLDDYLEEKNLSPPSFIKVDIEGAEIDFLSGAQKVIEAYSPFLLIEFHSAALARRGFDFLRRSGYSMTVQDGGPICEEEISGHFHESVFCSPNPLFRH